MSATVHAGASIFAEAVHLGASGVDFALANGPGNGRWLCCN
jgi:hypothetical protein